METARAKVTAMVAATAHPSARRQQAGAVRRPTKKHKEHKQLSKPVLCFLCLFAASFLLRRSEFSFLFFVETFLIFLKPRFEIVCSLLELIAIQQSATQRFEKRARPNVVSELLVRFLISPLCYRHEEFFIKRREPAFDSAQTQRTL